jgi:Sulfotransferase family
MTALVEVVDVETVEGGCDELLGFEINQPKTGSERSTYSLTLRGWVLGRQHPVGAVELVQGGDVLRSLAVAGKREDVAVAHPEVEGAGTSEFFATISSLALEPSFELSVQAVLDGGSRVPIATIRGLRGPVRSGFQPRLQPLMLTSTGRVGSTVLMNALAAHPGIAAYPPFQHEPRVATYWMEVFKTLSDPASYVRQLAPGGPLHDGWWLGSGEPMPRGIANSELEQWIAADAVETLAALCQGRIEALYEEIASRHSRPQATYFAEKFRTDSVPGLMWEFYPDAREVVLVRDFRDVACSILASSAKRKGMEQPSDPRVVLADIKARAGAVVSAWLERSKRAHLVRYEDLITEPAEVLEGVATYLGLDAGTKLVDAMVAALSEEGTAAEFHRTTTEVGASIGRWRRDLDDDAQREFTAVLGPELGMFGYDV